MTDHPTPPPLPTRTHYIYGSGEYGCLYDDGPHYAESLQDAVSALAETFDLSHRRQAELKRNRSLDLNPRRDGASYCEISECGCMTPQNHQDEE
jgi:hypothetical protein